MDCMTLEIKIYSAPLHFLFTATMLLLVVLRHNLHTDVSVWSGAHLGVAGRIICGYWRNHAGPLETIRSFNTITGQHITRIFMTREQTHLGHRSFVCAFISLHCYNSSDTVSSRMEFRNLSDTPSQRSEAIFLDDDD